MLQNPTPASSISEWKMISDKYKNEIAYVHTKSDDFGSRGFNWGYLVAGIMKLEGCVSVVDFGCGKNTLCYSLTKAGLGATGYDPGIPGLDKMPVAADLVVCTDVLEHIEPEHLDATMQELIKLAKKRLFVAVSTRPAGRILPSGRNAHLIVESGDWWRDKFIEYGFEIRRVWDNGGKEEWTALMNAP